MILKRCAAVAAMIVTCALGARQTNAQSTIRIEVENNQPANGFFFTPVWFGVHDGTFDYFDIGSAASMSTELLAESGVLDNGSGSGILNDFSASNPGGSQGVAFGTSGFGSGAGQPPVFDPGEVAGLDLNVSNPSANRWLSFASMLIPSNDAFIGNDNPFAYELFDGSGNFNGPITIQVFGDELWDAGTEFNDGLGAPFSANGGTSTDESLLVRAHPDGLSIFIGTGTAAGTTIGQGIGAGDLIATFRISAIPEPSSALLAFAALPAIFLRRRRKA